MCKTHRTQNFRTTRLSWYSFGDICRPFQPSHLQNHQFHFFIKLPTKPSSYAVVHRQLWPCAKPSELKTLVHQDFHGIHLGSFLGLSNPHIAKIPNFNFSQNSLPSHLARPWCTANLGHVQNPPNSKLSCTKTFMVFIWGFVRLSNPHISKITNFIFSQNSPPSHLAMPGCTANLGHVQNPPNSKLSCNKTFMVFIWGFVGLSNPHISKITNFTFSQNSPPSHLARRGAPPSLAMCKTHRTQNFRAPRL